MTLTELRYIVAVARERHFGRAADACFVSQPTLSVAVKKLEDELGVALFERGPTEVAVTPVGAGIVAQAQRVLEQAGTIRELAKHGKDPLAGPLRLGVIYSIAPYLLPALVPHIIRAAAEMPLIIEENFTHRLLEMLKSGEIDGAILALPFSEPGLMVQPLYDEPFLVAMPAGHAWAAKKAIAAADLKKETMLLLGNGHCLRDQVLQVCPEMMRFSSSGAEGIQRTFEGSSLETIRHMVASGVGLTVLRRLAGGAGLQAEKGRPDRLPSLRRSRAGSPGGPDLAQELHATRRSGTLRDAVLGVPPAMASPCWTPAPEALH